MLKKFGLIIGAAAALAIAWSSLGAGNGNGSGGNACGATPTPQYPAPPQWLIDRGNRSGGGSTSVAPSNVVLTEKEAEDILFMREEEKLARDVYLKMYERWKLVVFERIAASEQNHMDAMANIIARLPQLDDPVTNEGPVGVGIFVNDALKALYSELVNDGLVSREEALYVGAWIEERDMLDIQKAIENTDLDGVANPGLVATYESLLCGSRNHLRAFVYRIEVLFDLGDYEPQIDVMDEMSEDQDRFESQKEYEQFLDAIIYSEREQCGRNLP